MEETNLAWERAGRAWTICLTVVKTGLYLVFLVLCMGSEGIHCLAKGYFLCEITMLGFTAIKDRTALPIRTWCEFLLFGGIAIWMAVAGTLFPTYERHSGMMAVGFVCFLFLRWLRRELGRRHRAFA